MSQTASFPGKDRGPRVSRSRAREIKNEQALELLFERVVNIHLYHNKTLFNVGY